MQHKFNDLPKEYEGTLIFATRELRENLIDLYVAIAKACGIIRLAQLLGIQPRSSVKKRLTSQKL